MLDFCKRIKILSLWVDTSLFSGVAQMKSDWRANTSFNHFCWKWYNFLNHMNGLANGIIKSKRNGFTCIYVPSGLDTPGSLLQAFKNNRVPSGGWVANPRHSSPTKAASTSPVPDMFSLVKLWTTAVMAPPNVYNLMDWQKMECHKMQFES